MVLVCRVFLKAEDHFWFEIQKYAWLDLFACAGKMTSVVLGLTRMKYLLKVKSVSTYFPVTSHGHGGLAFSCGSQPSLNLIRISKLRKHR